MKYCENCKVHVNNEERVKCPLCKASLKQKENNFTTIYQAAPRFSPKQKNYNMTTRILTICSVIVVALAFLININYYKELKFTGLWCISVLILILFLWSLIKGCIFNFKNFNLHFTISLILLGGLSASIEYLAYIPFPNDMYLTLLYVLPGLFLIHFGTLGIRGIITKKTFADSSMYILFSTLVAIAYMIVFISVPLFEKSQIHYLLALGFVAGATLIALFILAPKTMLRELHKKFFV